MQPADAVRAWVGRAAVAPATTRTDPGGWLARTYTGGSAHEAKPDSLRIRRQKIQGTDALLAVEYQDQNGHWLSYVYGLSKKDDATWTVIGGAGGSLDGQPPWPEPFANLGGWGNREFLCAGGRVQGATVSRVRLVAADGQALEDEVVEGYALLMGDLPFNEEYTLELLDGTGHVLGRQRWGGRR